MDPETEPEPHNKIKLTFIVDIKVLQLGRHISKKKTNMDRVQIIFYILHRL